MVREPIVKGQFYPAKESELKKLIRGFISQEVISSKISAKGLILPHAGYVYSGKVAAIAASKILAKPNIIILGNNHTGYGQNFSLWAKGEWDTPLGKIAINEELSKKILASVSVIKEDFLAHQFEHSIEVELPILKYFFNEFTFVPIACKIVNLDEYRQASEQIYNAIKDEKENTLIIASTDMTHYEPDETARKKDRLAIESIINLDEESLIKTVEENSISMCGIAPVATALALLKKMGSRKASVAMYQTSGDASGDYDSVVGYVGIIIQ